MFDAFDDDLDFDENQGLVDSFSSSNANPESAHGNCLIRNLETEFEPLFTAPVQSKQNVSGDDSALGFGKLLSFDDAAASTSYRVAGEGFCGERRVETSHRPTEMIRCVRKRKFPGPAGVLPSKSSVDETRRSSSLSKYSFPKSKGIGLSDSPSTKLNDNGFSYCSQLSQDVFRKKPWLMMKRDLEQNKEILARLDKLSITEVLKKASRNLLPSLKAPLLCVLLQSINFSGEYASAVFRDPSGEISGWVDRLILKEHGSCIQPGCVLVLKQTSVLSVSSRKHYLNIHPTNIVQIYRSDCANDDKGHVVGEKTVTNWNDLIREAEESLVKSPNVSLIGETFAETSKLNARSDDSSVILQLQSYSAAKSSPVIEDGCRNKSTSSKRVNAVQRPQIRASTSKQSIIEPRRSNETSDRFCSLDDDLWNDDEFDSLLQHVDI